MTTRATPQLRRLADLWEAAIPSAVLSGIVSDAAHRKRPTKHSSLEDNPIGSWPTRSRRDAAPPGRWSRQNAAAIDISMSRRDQNTVHNRFKAVYLDKSDPRREYIAAFNGWDGQGSPGRYDLVNDIVTTTDNSHTWHEHVETFYMHATSDAMVDAVISVVRGETAAQYRARLQAKPPPQESDMFPATITVVDPADPTKTKTVTAEQWAAIMWARSHAEVNEERFLARRERAEILAAVREVLAEVSSDPGVPLTVDDTSAELIAGKVATRVAGPFADEIADRMQS